MKQSLLRRFNNQSGLTLIETLIATAIGVLVLATSYKLFTAQDDALTLANKNNVIRSDGRLAVETLAKELRQVGFSLPPDIKIISIDENSFEYRVGSDLQTTIPYDPSNPLAANIGDTTLNVVSADGFSDLFNICIYDPVNELFELSSIDGTPNVDSEPNYLPLNEPLTNDYKFGVNSKFIRVAHYNNVIIEQDGININKVVNGDSSIFLRNVVPANGLGFEYFDESGNPVNDISKVSKVAVTIRLEDPDNTSASIEFKTDVALRNVQHYEGSHSEGSHSEGSNSEDSQGEGSRR
jgi:Flp pilus assembly pilin Flp